MANKIKCTVETLILNYRSSEEIKCTFINRETIYDKDVSLSQVMDSTNTGIRFENCVMLAIPSSRSIKKFIPNLSILSIESSKLSKITSKDLKGFDCLRDLLIENCELEYLPGDLFKHTPQLEVVIFDNNKIKYIDEGILEPLQNLKIFSLLKNVNIDAMYNKQNNTGDVRLIQLQNIMRHKCRAASEFWQIENKLSSEFNIQKKENAELKRKFEDISGKLVKINVDNENLKKICLDQTEKNEKLEKKLETVLQQFQLIKQVSMDFSIKVNEKLFNVNKAILTAHSQVLAKLITENPEAVDLELKDISEASFQEILNFINDGSSPNQNANMVELFGASCRLEIETLTTIVAKLLQEKVNQVNALDVLILCNKFDKLKLYDELKMKAFTEFQKIFPNRTLLPELASQPDKLKLILQAKLDMDKLFAENQVV